jgi:Rrf2 family protein
MPTFLSCALGLQREGQKKIREKVMILGNQVEWALHCCSVMAGMPPEKYLSTKALAEFHGVPKEYLSKALQSLSQAGLVDGTLGPKGGYRLAKRPVEVTFLDIVEAVEGQKKSFNCTEIRGNNPCLPGDAPKPLKPCGIARVMLNADEAWREKLRAVTLEDLLATVKEEVPEEDLKASAEWLLSS